ncbi:MAG TPA: hypothetical protein VK590_04520, partial [Saprospiraceae bacterium]|nr:hypothetical protein [Saprospiraceae bacterium]
MKILIIAATDIELSGIKSKLANFDKDVSIDFKVTGIGSLQTCYHLLHTLNQIKYDFILQIGIAGSFD